MIHEVILSILFACHFSFVRYIVVKYKANSSQYGKYEIQVDRFIEAYYSKQKRLITGMAISYAILYINKIF